MLRQIFEYLWFEQKYLANIKFRFKGRFGLGAWPHAPDNLYGVWIYIYGGWMEKVELQLQLLTLVKKTLVVASARILLRC